MMKTIIFLFGLLLLAGCDAQESRPTPSNNLSEDSEMELEVGGVYASKNEEGVFTITKILALDDFAVHIRFYNEKFEEIPDTLSTADLTYLIGHAPMAREGFQLDKNHLITVESVTDDELEGYNIYLEAMRGN